MKALWNGLSTRRQRGKLDKDEEKFFKKLVKAPGYYREYADFLKAPGPS